MCDIQYYLKNVQPRIIFASRTVLLVIIAFHMGQGLLNHKLIIQAHPLSMVSLRISVLACFEQIPNLQLQHTMVADALDLFHNHTKV